MGYTELVLMRVALIRAAMGYYGIFLNTLSQIANWSSEAAELISNGEKYDRNIKTAKVAKKKEEKGKNITNL